MSRRVEIKARPGIDERDLTLLGVGHDCPVIKGKPILFIEEVEQAEARC
jgi:hypothetical protein